MTDARIQPTSYLIKRYSALKRELLQSGQVEAHILDGHGTSMIARAASAVSPLSTAVAKKLWELGSIWLIRQDRDEDEDRNEALQALRADAVPKVEGLPPKSEVHPLYGREDGIYEIVNPDDGYQYAYGTADEVRQYYAGQSAPLWQFGYGD